MATELYYDDFAANSTDWAATTGMNGSDAEGSGSEGEYGYDLDTGLVGRITGSFYLLITVAGLVGNCTVIYVVVRFAKMKTVTNCYILNLAVADALFVTFLTFLAITNLLDSEWIFGAFMCKVVFSVDGINMFISVFCLTAMSVDRYVAVCHAMKSRAFRNLKVATIINATIWGLSVLAATPIIHFTEYHDENGSKQCFMTFNPEDRERMFKMLCTYLFFVAFVVPMTVIVACYASIIARLRDMGKKTGKPEKSRKVNRLVLIVILTFVACWGPFYLVRLIFVYSSDFRTWPGAYILFELCLGLSYVNSAANPFLYAFFSDNFRKSFKKAWCCPAAGGVDLGRTSASLANTGSRWRFGKNGGRGKPNKKGGRFCLHDEDGDGDRGVSGANNQYPLTATAVTSAASESSYPRNGDVGNVPTDRSAHAIAFKPTKH